MASALSGIFASVILSSLGSGWLMALDGTIILLSSLYFMIWVRGYGPEGLSAGP
jgi:hypothetical protein